MGRYPSGRWQVAAAAMLAVLAALTMARCSSPQKEAMARSSALIASLKQRSFPGLPDALTPKQAMAVDAMRKGQGQWFVETGCFSCHDVSVYGVKSFAPIGPDLSDAVEDVPSRFGKSIDDFWHAPVGTMMMVRSQLIKLTPEEEAFALDKLKAAFAEYQRQKRASNGSRPQN